MLVTEYVEGRREIASAKVPEPSAVTWQWYNLVQTLFCKISKLKYNNWPTHTSVIGPSYWNNRKMQKIGCCTQRRKRILRLVYTPIFSSHGLKLKSIGIDYIHLFHWLTTVYWLCVHPKEVMERSTPVNADYVSLSWLVCVRKWL